MKKMICLAVGEFLLLFSLFAQDDVIEDTYLFIKPSLHIGGANIKSSGNSFNADSRIGYGIAAEIWHPLSKKLFLAGGAGFNSRGYKDVRVLYFDVPVSINYLIKKISIGGGAYWGMALGGKYENIINGWTKMKFGEGASANRSSTDHGYIVNVGYNTGVFIIMASYMGGLKNVIPNDRQLGDNSIKLNMLQGSVYLPIKSLTNKK